MLCRSRTGRTITPLTHNVALRKNYTPWPESIKGTYAILPRSILPRMNVHPVMKPDVGEGQWQRTFVHTVPRFPWLVGFEDCWSAGKVAIRTAFCLSAYRMPTVSVRPSAAVTSPNSKSLRWPRRQVKPELETHAFTKRGCKCKII